MTRATITVPVYPYMSNDAPRLVDVPAHVVGRLAVHRHVYWFKGEEPKTSGRYWTVSHIASGLEAGRALPQELRDRPDVRVRDLKAWAEKWQQDQNVTKLLDQFEAAIEAEGRFSRPTVDDPDLVYAAREAGWRITV